MTAHESTIPYISATNGYKNKTRAVGIILPVVDMKTVRSDADRNVKTNSNKSRHDFRLQDLETSKSNVKDTLPPMTSVKFTTQSTPENENERKSVISSHRRILDNPVSEINQDQALPNPDLCGANRRICFDDEENIREDMVTPDSNTTSINSGESTGMETNWDISISDSDECDTDLEIDPNFGRAVSRLSDITIGRDIYSGECERRQVVPQSHILHNLPETSLSLRNRSLGPAALPPLCVALQNNLRVERLNLDGTDITEDGIQYIAEMLLENDVITHLVYVSMEALVPSIIVSKFEGNPLTIKEVMGKVKHFHDAAANATGIKREIETSNFKVRINSRLSLQFQKDTLSNNSLGVRGSQVLGHVMLLTTTLTHLNLSGNKLGDRSSWYLANGIKLNTSITHLDLSYNDFGEQAGVFLGSAIARNEAMVFLNLAWNKVCGKGAVAIFKGLMVNYVLESLDISWNGLGYEGAVALSKFLRRNTGLRKMGVSNNRLDWTCCPLLALGLKFNTNLTQLLIGYNPLTTTGCMEILEGVATPDSVVALLDCSEVSVLAEADLLAATISRRRNFHFQHGGIVSTPDKIGKKMGRDMNPMLRIIEYLRLLGLRPLELMKSFDKTASYEMARHDFVEQIKKIGVKMHHFEVEALANTVCGKGYNKNVINYRKLSQAVREVVREERERKVREREKWLQTKHYHENILRKGRLDFIDETKDRMSDIDKPKSNSVSARSGFLGTSHDSDSFTQSKVRLSMCSPLETTKIAMASPTNKRRTKPRKLRKHKSSKRP